MVLLIGGGGLGGLATGSTFVFLPFTIRGDGVWEAVDLTKVSWSSSNPSVAQIIDQFGTFQAMNPGTATITASNWALSASLAMTVIGPASYPSLEIFPFGSPTESDTSRDARVLFRSSQSQYGCDG
jgi:hypothetical protein